jgi:cytochrome c-type biogenesis protein CcmH
VRARAAIAALIAATLLIAPGTALAQGGKAGNDQVEANATLPDIEDEVMCTICGTSLQLANSPQAERERAFINRLIAQGKTKDEIKDALVAEYGSGVLATPDPEGFDLTAYILPIVGVLVAIALIGLAARRWRRTAADDPAPITKPSAGDDERLEADLRRYDGA